MKKKIYLEITPFFPTKESFRGPYIYDQVKAIKRNSDFDVKLVKTVSVFSKEPEIYEYQGVKVYNFKVIDLPSFMLPGIFHTINLFRFERFLHRSVGVKPDDITYIHAHVAYPAGALASDLGKKYGICNFIQHHGLDVAQLTNGRLMKGSLKRLNDSLLMRRFLRSVNGTNLNIGVSQKVIEALSKIEGFNNPNTYVLYNGVDTTKFFAIEKKEDDDVFTIGCIGNFWIIKDQMTLLKALGLLVNEKGIKNIRVVFVGSGKTLDECMNYVEREKLGPYVEFRQEIDHTRLNEFYNGLDLFVLPSFYEAFGCVYAEALQTGIPIIAVEEQGIAEVVHEEDRPWFLMEKGDADGLAKRIEHFMRKGHNKADRYDLDIDKIIKAFLQDVRSAVC